jgi:DNA invertase Pin-like site-specific DNA recombinase
MLTNRSELRMLLAMSKQPKAPTALAYYRTSSAANVGQDKDSLERQKAAVRGCAAARGLELAGEYYDPAVSGADPVDGRPGFGDMLAVLLSDGCRTIIVENASRFARDLIVQETGYLRLKARGIELIAADSPESFITDTPTAVLIRQILGAVSQFEKAMLVEKLRGARDRKSARLGCRVEGNPAWKAVPDAAVKLARAASRKQLSLREISARLAAKDFLAPSGKPYGPESVQAMIDTPEQRAARLAARKQRRRATLGAR